MQDIGTLKRWMSEDGQRECVIIRQTSHGIQANQTGTHEQTTRTLRFRPARPVKDSIKRRCHIRRVDAAETGFSVRATDSLAAQAHAVPKPGKGLVGETVIVFDDIDAPRGSYVHWILWNIDPNIREIKENSVPEGAVQGTNDFKKGNYGGPCPPRRAHQYVFKIYALDILLNSDPNLTKKDLEKAMEGHILSRAQLKGVYKRN